MIVTSDWESIEDGDLPQKIEEMSELIMSVDDEAIITTNSRGNQVVINSTSLSYVEYEKER
jgi:hypothetical protein